MKNLVFAAIAAVILSAPLFAQTKTPVINERQKIQQERIKQGVKSGELTKAEAKKLKKEQMAIRHDKKLAKADGKVTAKEKKIINKEQNKASRHIYKMKHNKKTAPAVNNTLQ